MSNKNKILWNQITQIKNKICLLILVTVSIAFLELLIPFLMQKIIDEGILARNLNNVIKISLFIIFLYIFLSALNSYTSVVFSKLSVNFINDLKKEIITNIMKYPISFFDKNKTGYIISRIDELDALNSFFSPSMMSFIKSIISFIGAVFIIITIKWELLIVSLLLLPVLFVLTKFTSRRIYTTSKQLNEASANAQGEINEDILGLSEIKKLNLEKHKLIEIKKYLNIIADKLVKRNVFVVVGNETVALFSLISRILFIIIIAFYIIEGDLTMGEYFSLLSYLSCLFVPIQMYSSISLSIQPAIAVISRIDFFINNTTEFENNGSIQVNEIRKVQVNDLSFAYPESSHVILKNVKFALSSSQHLYLIGSNGSGKTTLTKLLLGFYSNYSGTIRINDFDLKEIDLVSLRRNVGIVSQKIHLFSGGIMDNIKQWNEQITDEEVILILREYELENILLLENSDNIKEGGKNLSGGQLQQISLARVLIQKPSLFIFDEPTSNLDSHHKEKFVQTLDKLKDTACIIVTHDDYLIKKAKEVNGLVCNLDSIHFFEKEVQR